MRLHGVVTEARSVEVNPSAVESPDGIRLHASLFRARTPSAGLLLVHGLQSHAGWFEASGTAAELAEAGVTCLAYDRRGSGRSDGVTGHAESAEDFLADLGAAAAALRRELAATAGPAAPLHALANCFGCHALLSYAAAEPDAFDSLVLTAPGTHMSRRASYSLGQKLSILLSPSAALFATPLRDEDFVSSGSWLEWIRRDARALRQVTAGFLRSAARLSRRTPQALRRLRIPLLVVLSRRDVLVDNAAVRRWASGYAGPHSLLEYDADHYVDFSQARPDFAEQLRQWVLREAPTPGAPLS